ncbi:MAG: YihY/virulence factor BrkB family protein [Firmicutes bacterium]|nr:YihY/virulence factor BrkB family protein [Bacillota bacterium]
MAEFIKKLKDFTFCNETGGRSAALAYYLLFSVFPVIGVFNIILRSYSGQIERFVGLLPSVTADIVEMYIEYVSAYPEITVLSAVSFAFFYMPFRAVKFILWDIRKVYGIEEDMHFIRRNLKVFIYTLLFLLVLVFTIVVMVIGGDLTDVFLGDFVGGCVKYFTPCFAMFVLLVFILRTGTGRQIKSISRGAAASAFLWHTGSIAFSFYVSTFNKYSIIYGSFGSLMVFFVWVYFSSFCVLMGVRINFVLADERKDLT